MIMIVFDDMNRNIVRNEIDTKKVIHRNCWSWFFCTKFELKDTHTSSSGRSTGRAGAGALGLRVERAPRTGGHGRAALRHSGCRDCHAARLHAREVSDDSQS